MLLAALVAFSACAAPVESDPTVGPQIGKADGTDAADHGCQVVLRGVGFKPGSPYTKKDGYIVWTGAIDVGAAAIADGDEVAVLYHRDGRPWYEAEATPTAIATRFTFDMSYGISSGDEGGTNWTDMTIELIPFVRRADGTRVFDHNALPDDFTNYVLSYGWGRFELAADPTVCAQS